MAQMRKRSCAKAFESCYAQLRCLSRSLCVNEKALTLGVEVEGELEVLDEHVLWPCERASNAIPNEESSRMESEMNTISHRLPLTGGLHADKSKTHLRPLPRHGDDDPHQEQLAVERAVQDVLEAIDDADLRHTADRDD